MHKGNTGSRDGSGLRLTLHSFGYRTGAERVIRSLGRKPLDVNILFDVRNLQEVHKLPNLKHLTGQDYDVVDFLDRDNALTNLARIKAQDFHGDLLTWFRAGKTWLNVAVGSMYGRHRSVAFVEKLARFLKSEFEASGQKVSIRVCHWTLNAVQERKEKQRLGALVPQPVAPGLSVYVDADPVSLRKACGGLC